MAKCKHSIEYIRKKNPHVNFTSEVPEQELIHKFVRRGDKVLEFGSNIGRSTIIAADCAGPKGRVVSFEQDRQIRARAQKNSRNYKNVQIYPAASDKPIYQSGTWYTSHKREKGWPEIEKVPLSTLKGEWDTVIADCEGCFSDIVSEAPFILDHARTIILENDDTDFKRQKNLQNTLSKMGFTTSYCAPHPSGKTSQDEIRDKCFFQVLSKDIK
tara:strand:+ start:22649 stop:23290 length:642 start_codon:yes stop_codon:yes gene_type:complete